MTVPHASQPAQQLRTERPFTGLSVRGISKSYAGIEVLSDCDIDVRPGEVVAVLGENGAGKSTLSLIIAGVVPPSRGTMTWNGMPYEPASPGDAIDAGIGLIHQEMRLLPELTIAENVFVGRTLLKRGGFVDRNTMNERAARQLRRLGLDVAPTTLVKHLRVAAQQQVEIAKALMLDSRLLILDEPTASLGGEETDLLFERVEALKADGVSFIYISHRLEEIARIADRIVVLRDGRQVTTHETADVPVHQLIEEMVGRKVDRLFPAFHAPSDEIVLEVDGLSAPDRSFQDVSFHVRKGEVLGIAGIVGAGRTEVVRAIVGADDVAGGAVRLRGRRLPAGDVRAAIDAGIVLVPEDRKQQGLIVEHTIQDNVVMGNYDLFAPNGWVVPRHAYAYADRAINHMGVKGRPGQPVRELSGGNQQKVVIAKWIERGAQVFILDEPTRGIDVGARASIYETVKQLAESGMAVILVSSDLDEVIGLSHRVMVLARGRNRGILDAGKANRVSVMELATL